MIFLINITIFSVFSTPIVRGVLLGRKKFTSLGFSLVSEASLKLSVAILLVIIGFGVFGAIIGILFGSLVGFGLSLYFNKDIIKEKREEVILKEIYPKSFKYSLTMLIILLVFSIDIILAKRFFISELAGKYAVISILGKMVFFITIAISKAMFPLASERHDNNIESEGLFKKSLLLVTSLCVFAVLIYSFFPELIINLLYGNQYIEMAPYLIYSGIAFSFLSLSNLVLIYGLSTDRLRNAYYLLTFLVIEITLLFLFHNSILEYILAFMVSNIIMFIGALFSIKTRK